MQCLHKGNANVYFFRVLQAKRGSLLTTSGVTVSIGGGGGDHDSETSSDVGSTRGGSSCGGDQQTMTSPGSQQQRFMCHICTLDCHNLQVFIFYVYHNALYHKAAASG